MAAKKKSRSVPAARKAASTIAAVRPNVSEFSRHDLIARAKLEWEGTADALESLVCLLGRDGQVLRANRVLEDWSLGSVAAVIGKGAHAVLHRSCRSSRCVMAEFMTQSLQQIQSGRRTQFETQLTLARRSVRMTIMPMRLPVGLKTSSGDPLAVLVVDDVSALRQARHALERLNVTLEGRVRTRTAALATANLVLRNEVKGRKIAEQQLRTSRDDLAVLSAQLIRAQEGERQRIAHELHDSVGQSLSAAKYTVERALELYRMPDAVGGMQVLELAIDRIQQTAESIRAISTNLRPAILDDLGVASALQWFCRDFAEIYPTLSVTAEISVKDRDVPKRLVTVVYRCVQELLNNVAKHAQATAVEVRLALVDHVLQLRVRDDGIGPGKESSEARKRGSGLRNLRERAQMTGGTFGIVADPKAGTLAELAWPLPAEERQVPRRRTARRRPAT
jgi:signal transduction histidine kinase